MAAVENRDPARVASGIHPKGSAWAEGRIVALEEARIPITDWGFTRSDVTYDVVHVWKGSFFRLDEHIARFQASMAGLHMSIPMAGDDIAAILHDCVRASGLKDAYVAMICTRGNPAPGGPRHPANCVNRFWAFVLPWSITSQRLGRSS